MQEVCLSYSRRELLRTFALTGAGTALSTLWPQSPLVGDASAEPWGDYPTNLASTVVPVKNRPKNILEIFLQGGICPWETFYVVENFGKANQTMWWTFQKNMGSELGVPAFFASCGFNQPLLQQFAVDAAGSLVQLGPFVAPLRARKDVIDRMRTIVMAHESEAHQVAVPLALTGYVLGSPRMAGVGAAVNHYFQTHDPTTKLPFAYVLATSPRGSGPFEASFATGQHPSASQPPCVYLNTGLAFSSQLLRKNMGPLKDPADALLAAYQDEFRQKLIAPSTNLRVRSAAFDAEEQAAAMLAQSAEMAALFTPENFDQKYGTSCNYENFVATPKMQLDLAVHLLNAPNSQIKHMTVVDTAFKQSTNGVYDTHMHHVRDSATNMLYFTQQLVDHINLPGEKDPKKLNLDETLIILNTEFGRTIDTQQITGRNHWPKAYTQQWIGGPIGLTQKGIFGSIDSGGLASGGVKPSWSRAAVLACLGIYPFANENFSIAEFAGTAFAKEAQACIWLREQFLGLKP